MNLIRRLAWSVSCPFLAQAAQVVGIAGGLKGLFGGDGGGSALQGIGREQWELFRNEGVPLLRQLAGMTKGDVKEEQALAAGATKDAYATARRNLVRAIGTERNPGDPGYAALLAPHYMDEAAAVSKSITEAKRNVEDRDFSRTLQAVNAYRGLPQDASSNLRASAALSDSRNSQLAYGGTMLAANARRWFGGGQPAEAQPGALQYGADSLYDFGQPQGYTDAQYGMDDLYNFRDGGAVRTRYAGGGAVRRYADGGAIQGPGTGTSDSVKGKVKPGSYILSADTVRAIGTKKVQDLMEKAGVRPGIGGDDPDGVPVRLSNGEQQIPPRVVSYYGEEFFNKLQQKYHRPVMDEGGMANGGAIRARGLPRLVEDAIFKSMPNQALMRRRL